MKKQFWIFIFSASMLLIGFQSFAQKSNNDFEISKNLDIFTELYKQLDLNYVDQINPGDLVKTGIDAMLGTLDPFTNYIPESDIEDYKLMTTGQYGGIGALINKQGDYVIVSEPYEGFPAQKSGLKPGDKILEVDGHSAKAKTTDEVSTILKGEPGTAIKLLIEREGTPKPFAINIQRETIKIDNIPYYGMLTPNIGYLKLSGFTQNASSEVKKAFLELKEKNELKGLIFDLRGNGGGLLNEAVDIVNIFAEKGELVVATKGKESLRDKSYYTSAKAVDTEIPLIFLVDPGSASASEIVSGAIQDMDRGVILGERTYGKGLVQNVFPLSYNAKVKITVAKYYIPSGRCIQAIDYSHKGDDGKANKVPDSLISEFSTKNGRKVYDGGGIEPDVKMDPELFSPVTAALFSKFILFDYANKYNREHDSIPAVEDFTITDEIYNDFKNFVAKLNFEYTTDSEKTLLKLKEIAQDEKYYNDIKSEIELLESKLIHNKDEDLAKHRDEISEILKIEIVSRYYYQKGKIKASLESDPEIKKAIELIGEKEFYSSILSGNSKSPSKMN